jgi:nucleoside-diphosphate-sugar epimerase
MRLIITGGAGFLGFHLAAELAASYSRIITVDIADVIPGEYPANHEHISGDVRDPALLERLIEKGDCIVHAAAALPLWDRKSIFDINVNGTRNVLAAALRGSAAKVVYVSSTAVYGVPEKHPIEETDPLVGVGPYGESKIAAEKACVEFREKGLCVPVVRPKTFVGTARLGVFQILYDWILSGKKIPVIGNGNNRYQLLEVGDLADAIRRLLEAPPERANGAFNVGAESFGTVRDDLGALCRYAGTGATVLSTPAGAVKCLLGLFEAMRLSPLYKWVYATADRDSFVSVEKLQKAVGWRSRFSNSEALIRSYQWYLDHRRELAGVGITHRVAWKQGVLALAKKLL